MAIRTALDGWLRTFRNGNSGPGLRGGMWDADFNSFPDHAVLMLQDSRFADDVTVSGQAEWFFETNKMHLTLTVSGPRGHNGELVADGQFGFGGPFSDFVVSGSLGGNRSGPAFPPIDWSVCYAHNKPARRKRATIMRAARLLVSRRRLISMSAVTTVLIGLSGGVAHAGQEGWDVSRMVVDSPSSGPPSRPLLTATQFAWALASIRVA